MINISIHILLILCTMILAYIMYLIQVRLNVNRSRINIASERLSNIE